MAKYMKATALFFAFMAILQPFTVLAEVDSTPTISNPSGANTDGPDNGNTAGGPTIRPSPLPRMLETTMEMATEMATEMAKGGAADGDPLIKAFDGTPFFFHGEPGKMYNLVSVKDSFQVAALLKEANNALHIGSSKNGTYIEALGVEVEGVRIVASTYADDSSRMTITINDEAQDLSSEIKQVIQLTSGDSLTIAFTPFQQTKGSVLTISSSAFAATANLVPPGLDHAGFWQPSYLNFGIALMKDPTQPLQGVIGDTYHYKANQMAASTIDTPETTTPVAPFTDAVYPVFPDSAYELPTLFAAPRFAFPASFIHDIIAARKRVAMRMATSATNIA